MCDEIWWMEPDLIWRPFDCFLLWRDPGLSTPVFVLIPRRSFRFAGRFRYLRPCFVLMDCLNTWGQTTWWFKDQRIQKVPFCTQYWSEFFVVFLPEISEFTDQAFLSCYLDSLPFWNRKLIHVPWGGCLHRCPWKSAEGLPLGAADFGSPQNQKYVNTLKNKTTNIPIAREQQKICSTHLLLQHVSTKK